MTIGELLPRGPVLLAAALLLVLLGWLRARARRTRLLHPAAGAFAAAAPLGTRVLWRAPVLLRAAALALLAAALAFPVERDRVVRTEREAGRAVVLLDVSRSMLAEDVGGRRIELARRIARRFVEARPRAEIGLVAFAGRPLTAVPLTPDHRTLREGLDRVEPGRLPEGTALGAGLATAVLRLAAPSDGAGPGPGKGGGGSAGRPGIDDPDAAGRRTVLLVSDGADNTGPVDAGAAVRAARSRGVRVHAVGVGRDGTATVRVPDGAGGTRRLRARLEVGDELLGEVARSTGGDYRRVRRRGSVEEVVRRMAELDSVPVQRTVVVRTRRAGGGLAAAALALLALELALRAGPARRGLA